MINVCGLIHYIHFWMYICVLHMNVRMFKYMWQTYVYIDMEIQRSHLLSFSITLHSVNWGRVPDWTQRLSVLSSLTNYCYEYFAFASFVLGLQEAAASALLWCWEFEFFSPCSCSRHFVSWAIFPPLYTNCITNKYRHLS